MSKICQGFDAGTMTLVSATRGDSPEEIRCKREINAFLKIPLANKFTFNALKASGKVKLVERNGMGYAIGESAVNLAYTLGAELSRPMKDGTLNPQETDAFEILKAMIHSLVGEFQADKAVIYYSVPADAVNAKTNAAFHSQVLKDIFSAYRVKEKRIEAYPVNEALALVFAELGNKNFTGISCSFGSGMVNTCVAMYGQPALQFSTVNSGDWIDEQSARAANVPVVVVNQEKMKLDLNKSPTTPLERALHASYRILVENTLSQISHSISTANLKIKPDNPFDIVIAGGVVSPPGFENLFKECVKTANLPIPIGDIIRPEDNHFAVARGCLIAAEMSQ